MLLAKRMVLQAGLETVYGTDPTLTATAAIMASNISLTPLDGSSKDRQRAHAEFGGDPTLHVNTHQTLSFDVELAGSGAAGTAPLWGPLMQACNMTETVTADTSAVYTPVGFNHLTSKSVTIYFNQDGIKYKLTGARGTFKLALSPNDIPKISFTFTGQYNAAADVALPSVETTLDSWIDGIEVNKANTQFTLFGVSAVLNTLSIDIGSTVVFRDRPNAALVAVTGRSVTGSIEFEQTTVAAKPWIDLGRAGTLGAMQFVHGTVAGNIVQFDSDKVQLSEPKLSATDDIVNVSANLLCTRNSGDELTVTVK